MPKPFDLPTHDEMVTNPLVVHGACLPSPDTHYLTYDV